MITRGITRRIANGRRARRKTAVLRVRARQIDRAVNYGPCSRVIRSTEQKSAFFQTVLQSANSINNNINNTRRLFRDICPTSTLSGGRLTWQNNRKCNIVGLLLQNDKRKVFKSVSVVVKRR